MKNHFFTPVLAFFACFVLGICVISHCFAQDTAKTSPVVINGDSQVIQHVDTGSFTYVMSVIEKLVSSNAYATIIAVISILGVILSFIPESIVPANGVLHAFYLFLRYITQAFIKK